MGRVLVVVARDTDNPSRAGGDRHVCLLAHELAQLGNEVTILCSRHESQPRESTVDGVRVVRTAPLRIFPAAAGFWLARATRRRWDLVVEEMIGGSRVPFFAPLLTSVPVIGFWYQDNRPLFVDHYGPILARLGGVVQALVLRVHRRSWIVCPSNSSRDWLLSQGFERQSLGVFYPSADPLHLADPSTPFDGRRNSFVTVGNIRPLKRFEEAIQVLALIRQHVPDAELFVIGRRDDDGYLRRLRELVTSLGLSNAAHFKLDITETEKYEILAKAKVLTIHSASEGFGLTVSEAGLSGVPSVVNSGVPEEVFVDGVTAISVPIGDKEGFSVALTRLMQDRECWEMLSKEALEKARTFKTPRMDATLQEILTRWRASLGSTGRSR